VNSVLYFVFHRITKCFQMRWFTTLITDDPSMDPINLSDVNLVITWSRNPQSRLRSDPGKLKKCDIMETAPRHQHYWNEVK